MMIISTKPVSPPTKEEIEEVENELIGAKKSLRSKWWEDDLAWILEHMISQVEDINNDELIQDYAHRINLWMNYGYGDIYSFDEFLEYVRTGSFIDYDGSGAFVDNITGKEIKDVRCNVEWLKKHKPENSDYIMWFNK